MTNSVVQFTCIHSYSEHSATKDKEKKTTTADTCMYEMTNSVVHRLPVFCTGIHTVTVNMARTYTQTGKGSYSEYTIIQILLIYALTPL